MITNESIHPQPSSISTQFTTTAPKELYNVRKMLTQIVSGSMNISSRLIDLRSRLCAFADGAKESGFKSLAQTTWAIESLVTDLGADNQLITETSQQTLARAVDLLVEVTHAAIHRGADIPIGGNVVIVSQDSLLRNSITRALASVSIDLRFCHDAELATVLAETNATDACVIDFDVPAALMLCRHLRDHGYADMPAIFLVNSIDLSRRSQVMLAKGTDLALKKFLASEFALRVLIHVHRYHMRRGSMQSVDTSSLERSKTNAAKTTAIPEPQNETHETEHRANFRIQNILVPVDLSHCSKPALLYAVEFAKEYGAKLHVLYIAPPYTGTDPYDFNTQEDVEKQRREEGREKLRELVENSVPGEIAVETYVRNGRATSEILEKAKELNTDLIIISTHGHLGISQASLGGTTEGVVRQAPCPVLVVREHEHEFLNMSSNRLTTKS